MKKIVMMLLGIAATINVMAVTYTAKAIVTLTSTSGFSCQLTLRQSNDYAALDGSELSMIGRKIALYAVNGTTPLQIAKAADLSDVKLGLMTDASTDYTITVSSVEGETLYIWDGTSASYALTEGAVYNFTATADQTDEARFAIKKTPLPTAPEFCFRNNELTVNGHAGESLVIASKEGLEIENVASLPATYSKNLSAYNGRYIVTLNSVAYQIDVNPAVTEVVVVP